MPRLPFLNRAAELQRLRKRLRARSPSLSVLYGRRRCGKSRLVEEALKGLAAIYFLADQREAPLQRRALAREIGRVIPGFDRVEYPGWDELFERFRADAPRGAVLALDELPFLVDRAPELPSILQKHADSVRTPLHLVLCGSSQRMMLGLTLDADAPLYGRAHELMRIVPLGIEEVPRAFRVRDPFEVLRLYAFYGGVPRYWELARDEPDAVTGLRTHVLDPLGVLHREPERLLADDLRDQVQAASVLSLVGQGCHRSSEIAGRLGVPATSIARPLSQLVELGFLAREVPYGASPRDSKKSLYRVADPFLLLWYRVVQPNMSRLAAGAVNDVARELRNDLDHHVGEVWEQLARDRLPHLRMGKARFGSGRRWWGGGLDGKPLELDIVADALDERDTVLVAEAKLRVSRGDIDRILHELARKSAQCPALQGKTLRHAIFAATATDAHPAVITAADIIGATRVRR
jgi:uncharacterized protein